jgi:hypothetical protein
LVPGGTPAPPGKRSFCQEKNRFQKAYTITNAVMR